DGEIVLVRHHEIEPATQYDGALLRSLAGPGRHRGLRRFDRAPRLGHAHLGHGADALAGSGIVDVDRRAAVRVAPFAGEITLLPKQFRIFELDTHGNSSSQSRLRYAFFSPATYSAKNSSVRLRASAALGAS